MGACNSKVSELTEMIDRVDPNDVQAVKNLLADLWNVYHLLDSSSQKRLDVLAGKVASLAKSP